MSVFMLALEILKAVRSIAELLKLVLEMWRDHKRQRMEARQKKRG